jgi:2-C-methyl-D-erythritol 4-phosphate cytidylyltransferase
MITALLLAAGKGIRFGSSGLPKQFSEIAGIPLFIHSVRAYTDIAEIDQVIVVANPALVEETHEALRNNELLHKVTVTIGGDTRQASVQNAAALMNDDAMEARDIIILHNSVSPNTSAEFIHTCLDAMAGSDAVQACVPDTRTVFETDGEFVKRVLPRSRLVYNCDPTIYRGDVFRKILQTQKESGMSGDTTLDTARHLGYRIRLVQSDYENIKVTNGWDLEAVRAAMGHGTK